MLRAMRAAFSSLVVVVVVAIVGCGGPQPPASTARPVAAAAPTAAPAVDRHGDAGVPSDRIEVTVSKGWVTLKGEVEWGFQREDAERAARRVTGVRGVSNLIVVKPRMKPTPEEMKRRIEEALVRSAAMDAKRISVEVQGDTVILRGTVRSLAEKQEAERVAWSAPGVAMVENRITVEL